MIMRSHLYNHQLVIVKMASHDHEVDSTIDRVMLAAFAAIGDALG